MAVDTTRVTGRRNLRFNTLDEILADAERMAGAENVRTLGNWSLGQILQHLAIAMELAVEPSHYKPPFYIRIVGPLLKRRMLNKGLAPGFQLPREMHRLVPPAEITTAQGLAALHNGVHRLQRETLQPSHFVFGKMTSEDWHKLQLRHAELHLSFVVQDGPEVSATSRK